MKGIGATLLVLSGVVVVGKHSVSGFGCGLGLRPNLSRRVAELDGVAASGRRGGIGPRVCPRRLVTTCKLAGPRTYSSGDWLDNIKNLPKSRLLFNIRQHLLANTGFAFIISLVHAGTPQHIIDDLHVSTIPHTIMAGALGLLLVFRTNAAYNRFWEARKIWGSVVNTVRSLARVGMVLLGPESPEFIEFREYLKAYPFLLKQHLRNERDDLELAFLTLPEETVIDLQEDPNPPLYACQIMSEVLSGVCDGGGRQMPGAASGGSGGSSAGLGSGLGSGSGSGSPVRVGQADGDFVSVSYRMEMERGISGLIDYLGMCERILTTPVPRGYSRHTSRFLTVYGLTLPIVLVPHTELFTAPVVCAVCWGLFSIEEIAYFIEQPFDESNGQLDLHGFAEKMRKDIDRMCAKSALNPPHPSEWALRAAAAGGLQPQAAAAATTAAAATSAAADAPLTEEGPAASGTATAAATTATAVHAFRGGVSDGENGSGSGSSMGDVNGLTGGTRQRLRVRLPPMQDDIMN